MDKPAGSRLFIVCGHALTEVALRRACSEHGTIQHVKMLPDKGVAYVKFPSASQAAKALEHLHLQTIKDGKVTVQLKVMFADPVDKIHNSENRTDNSTSRNFDPDNTPPRSRLFLVVPRDTSPDPVEQEMSKYEGLEYVKSDLVKSKGIIYVKFRLASSALKAKEDIEQNNYMLVGKRVKVFEAEPKSSSRDGIKDDDNRRLYTPSATPTDMNRPGHLSGHSRYSPALVDYDRNPNFWAWMYAQNVDVHHVTQSLKTIKQLHARFAQETGTLAGHSMSQSIASCDDWVSGPRCVSSEGKPLLPSQLGPPGPPPLQQSHGSNLRLSNSMGAFTDPTVPAAAYFNPMDSQPGPHMLPQQCHSGGVHGSTFPTTQHPIHNGHQLPAAGFAPGLSTMYKPPPPEPMYGSQVPFQSYIPAPSMSSDIFTQPLPCDENSWSHSSSHSCNMPAHCSAPQPVSGTTSLPTMAAMGHGSLLHAPHGNVPPGHSSSLSNPGSIAAPNASFPPPGLTHCSVPRPPLQGQWPQVQTRFSATGTVASTNTSGLSSDIRVGSSLQQQPTPASPPLPPGFQFAGKGSRQLLVQFSIAAQGDVPIVNTYMSRLTSQLDGIEGCTPLPLSSNILAVWYHCVFLTPHHADIAVKTMSMSDAPPACRSKLIMYCSIHGPAGAQHASGSYPPPSNPASFSGGRLSRGSAVHAPSGTCLMPLPGRMTPTELQTQGQSYSAPQTTVSPQLPTSVVPLEDAAPADPPGLPCGVRKSCSSDAHTESSTSKIKGSVTESTAAWPKAAPEVLFFHMSQLSMPEYALGQYFKQFGEVKYVVVHPSDGRWGAVTFEDSDSAEKVQNSGRLDMYGCKLTCLAHDISPPIDIDGTVT
eukprot:jgi/Ulvmu1/7954/UM004_0187.1